MRAWQTLCAVVLICAAGSAAAFGWPPQQPYAPQYGYPTQPQAVPANPWTAAPTPPVALSKPKVEVSLSHASPYLLQPAIYAIRVVSEENLSSIDIALPRIDGAAVDQLDGPRAYSRGKGADRRIVTEVRYAVTPFKAGPVSIPGTVVKVRQGEGKKASELVRLESDTLEMSVLPADPSVKPWLPLTDLRIHGRHDASRNMRVGEPFTLTVTLSAKGMTGSQLPGIEPMLISDDFKFYPERPRISQKIGLDGKTLEGERVESFTVIPQHAGALSMPVLDIAYWDTANHRRARAVWSGMHFSASGAQILDDNGQPLHSEYFSDDYRLGRDLKMFWLPILLLLAGTAGFMWWLSRGRGAWTDGDLGWSRVTWSRRMNEWQTDLRHQAADRIKAPLHVAGRNPAVRQVVEHAGAFYRISQCLRCLNEAEDARGLCRVLRRFACRYLRLPANSSLASIADALHGMRPRLDREHIRQLFAQLDAAAYGDSRLDVPEWKRAFRSLLRRVLVSRRRRRQDRIAARKLPDLNPQI
ncbi:MAG: BatD family protein [Gammaproteobacteria bacterium]|nr:BatD family protein [Gammaproteobacteria bacterium]MCP5138003.1 BatD family protein [Gammaproteobacteria bacterium]